MRKLNLLERIIVGTLWCLMIVFDVINRDWDVLKEDWAWLCGTLKGNCDDLLEEDEEDEFVG